MFKNDFPYNWSHFAACETGFNGSSCDQQCPYPSYGLNCASKCNCIYIDCHHKYGCHKSTGGIFLFIIITACYYYCFIFILFKFILLKIMSSAECFSTGVDWYQIMYSYGGVGNDIFFY